MKSLVRILGLLLLQILLAASAHASITSRDTDINMAGAKVEGENITLAAARDLNLAAVQNTEHVQTYFSATPGQRADPYINTGLFGDKPGSIMPNMWLRDADRLDYFSAVNGSAKPVYPVEEFVLGGAIGGRVISAFGRFIVGGDLSAAAVAAKGGTEVIRFGPTNPGPLPDAVANTFRGGAYTQTTLSESTTLYRVSGGTAGEMGQYWTTIKPSGPFQAQIDLALKPEWGNTATQITTIKVPAGQTIYQGAAASQGGAQIGGGSQVFIPRVDPSWVVR
jgi:hypothetical protein